MLKNRVQITLWYFLKSHFSTFLTNEFPLLSMCGLNFLRGGKGKCVHVEAINIILMNRTSGSHPRLHIQVLCMDLFIDFPLI